MHEVELAAQIASLRATLVEDIRMRRVEAKRYWSLADLSDRYAMSVSHIRSLLKAHGIPLIDNGRVARRDVLRLDELLEDEHVSL